MTSVEKGTCGLKSECIVFAKQYHALRKTMSEPDALLAAIDLHPDAGWTEDGDIEFGDQTLAWSYADEERIMLPHEGDSIWLCTDTVGKHYMLNGRTCLALEFIADVRRMTDAGNTHVQIKAFTQGKYHGTVEVITATSDADEDEDDENVAETADEDGDYDNPYDREELLLRDGSHLVIYTLKEDGSQDFEVWWEPQAVILYNRLVKDFRNLDAMCFSEAREIIVSAAHVWHDALEDGNDVHLDDGTILHLENDRGNCRMIVVEDKQMES
jgi:hypothetical protein